MMDGMYQDRTAVTRQLSMGSVNLAWVVQWTVEKSAKIKKPADKYIGEVGCDAETRKMYV